MSKGSFEPQVVETRYGRRLLIRLGGKRMCLKREIRELFSAIIDAVFSKNRGSKQEQ